jgi:hypothetical protein
MWTGFFRLTRGPIGWLLNTIMTFLVP